MAVESLKCKECGESYPLDARFVCEQCFGPLEVTYDNSELDPEEARRKIQAGSRGIWRYSDFLPFEGNPRDPLEPGLTPLIRADRLADRLGLGEVWIKNDAANPTHSFKDRVVAVAIAKAKELGFETVACASTGNLANAVAAHSAAAGLDSYVFVPADLEEQKLLATGIYGTNLVGIRGTYDDVNRLCTELSQSRPWAFVNVNLRPYYSEGSKTLAFETIEQLGWKLPDRVVAPIASGSMFTKVAKGMRDWIELGLVEGDLQARAPARDDREEPRDRGPGRRPLRPRAGSEDRRRHRVRHRRSDPRRDPPARRDHWGLHGDGGRRDDRCSLQARRDRRDRSGRAGRRVHHRRGAEDARGRPRIVPDARDRAHARCVRRGVPGSWGLGVARPPWSSDD